MYKLSQEQIKKVVENGSRLLFEYCQNNNIHYIVTGSSGGLDSAIILGFAKIACDMARKQNFSLTSIGLIMPCESSSDSIRLGRQAIKKFYAEEIYIDLSQEYHNLAMILMQTNGAIQDILKRTGGQQLLNEWDLSNKVARGNIKARLRMMLGTYHVARVMKGMVLSTDNLSEYWMAFWTICGDVGDFGIIQNILKGLELYDIARYLKVPQEIITAKPDDGLGIAGGDEDQLGASYPVLDKIMIELIQQGFNPDGSKKQLDNLSDINGVNKKIVYKLAKRCLNGSYKRKGTIRLSRQVLGLPDIQTIKLD